jgi:hypothetical protein
VTTLWLEEGGKRRKDGSATSEPVKDIVSSPLRLLDNIKMVQAVAHLWLTPVILAIWETEIRRIEV